MPYSFEYAVKLGHCRYASAQHSRCGLTFRPVAEVRKAGDQSSKLFCCLITSNMAALLNGSLLGGQQVIILCLISQ